MTGPESSGAPDERLWAVLIPPQLARFRRVFGLQGAPLEISFAGWHRIVLLSPDRCFTIPRSPEWVPGQRREAAVVQVIDHPLVPRFIELREDPEISPYPILVTQRRAGHLLADVMSTASRPELLAHFAQLGAAVAGWHSAPAPAGLTPQEHLDRFRGECATETVAHRAYAAAATAGLPGQLVEGWLERLASLLALPDVLVHGDLHEGQVLLDDAGAVSAVLDWETAGSCHPAKDFDLGEWDWWVFAEHEPDFAAIREAGWSAYARARGLDVDPSALHLFFTITDLARLRRPTDDPESMAWHDRRLRNLVAALRAVG